MSGTDREEDKYPLHLFTLRALHLHLSALRTSLLIEERETKHISPHDMERCQALTERKTG
jgi:hypothetical protein